MSKIFYFFIFILLILGNHACKKQKNKPKAKEVIHSESTSEAYANENLLVVNDSLVTVWIAVLNERIKTEKRFELTYKLIENQYDATLIDTLKVYHYKKTQIEFYKTQNWENLIGALIQNEELELFDNFNLRTSTSYFAKLLNLNNVSPQISISNLEQTQVFTFSFKNDRLHSIIFEGYID